MAKKIIINSIFLGNLIAVITHLVIDKIPNEGILAIFSKIYHGAWLISGSTWNHWIVSAFQDIPVFFLPLYRIIMFVLIYSGLFGILGFCLMSIRSLFLQKNSE